MVVGRHRVVGLSMPLQQELADQSLAFHVEVARLLVGSPGKRPVLSRIIVTIVTLLLLQRLPEIGECCDDLLLIISRAP